MDERALTEFFSTLDRAFFLNGPYKALAGCDAPLPIGYEQTISQPSLVLEMTRLLSPEKDSWVLEIGTGSGFQTALLAEFSARVYTVERVSALARKAEKRLTQLGYDNIVFLIADGSAGWQEYAPFDRIIVTAAAGKKPLALIGQLAPNGRMIVPVGPPSVQDLLLITRDERGALSERSLGQVQFVEMVGEYGWNDSR